MDASIPECVGDYRIVSLLGRGGSALVYAGVHRESGAGVAVKVADAAGPIRTGWFRREASLAARLSHPSIVPLLASGVVDGRPYLVFERVDGPTLEEIADDLNVDAIVAVGVQVLDALGYAHDAGVVHCDVKPDNVLVASHDLERGRLVVKLADFGLAATREPERSARTHMPLVAGTPGYLSPEQARGSGHLPPAVDIYATGALLYRLVAGHPPHFGSTSTEVVQRTLDRAPLPLSPRSELSVPERLVDVVHAMLARDAAYRPASASRAKAMLQATFGGSRPPIPASGETPEFGIPRDTVRGGYSGPTTLSEDEPTFDEDSVTVAVASEAVAPTPLAIPVSRFARRSARLLGRDAELAAMLDRLGPDVGRLDRPRLRLVGPAGSGRTRLLRELAVRLESLDVPSFMVTGRRGGEAPPFEILAALALEVAGAGGLTSPWLAAEQLSRALESAGVDRDDPGRDALVSGVVGVGLPTSVGELRMHAYRAFDKLLVQRLGAAGIADVPAALQPSAQTAERAVLIVDDADHADEESLAVLDALARSVEGRAGAPHVVLSTAHHAEDPGAHTVTLEPLDRAAAVELLAALTDRDPVELEPLAAAVGGAPADLVFAAVSWLVTGRTHIGFEDLVDARLAKTDPGVMRVLEAAAIWEGDAPARSLSSIVAASSSPPIPRAEADALVQSAVLEGWIARVPRQAAKLEPCVRICSERVQTHIARRAQAQLGRSLHRAAATWLDRESRDTSEGAFARKARFAERAGELAVAAHAWATAGRSMTSPDAKEHLSRALALAARDDEAANAIDKAAVLAQLAELGLAEGDVEHTARLARAGLAAAEADRPVLRARLHRLASSAFVARREHEPALTHLDQALDILGDEGDPTELASALADKGWVLAYLQGHAAEGVRLGRRAKEVAARIDAPRFQASLCGKLGANYLRMGDWDGQLATNLEDLGLSIRAADVGGVVRGHINIGVCYTNRSLPALARAHTEEALRLAVRYGRLHAALVARNNLAMIAADDGRAEDAERLARETLALADRTGLRAALGETKATLARVLLGRGDYDGAEKLLFEVLADGPSTFENELAIRLLALVDVARNDPDRALERLGTVLDAGEYDPYERANTRLVAAVVHEHRGDADRADRARALADEVYRRLGADPRAERRRWSLGGSRRRR